MEIGVIGLGGSGRAVVGQLLEKTARNLSVYDPDGRGVRRAVNVCATAAELCDRCDRSVVALEASADLTRLCNSIAPFVRPGQIFIDLTDTSPALAHAAANGMRRLGAAYIDCGVFGREGLGGPFLLFAGGDSEAFAAALPLIRCFAPDCHYAGPPGRGRAMRVICRALAAQLMRDVDEAAALAASFGVGREAFTSALASFERIADPLAELGGGLPGFSAGELAGDAALASEMARRAGLELGGLFAAGERADG